jgi:sterol desaturase/sphingolipid hydroxylase (fatty acid hydroxylase superfamily)
MQILKMILAAGASLVFLALLFIPMERVFPARVGQKVFRPRWKTDLCFFLGQYLLWGGLVLWLLEHFGNSVHQLVPPSFIKTVHSFPIWLQGILVIFLSDLFIYWGHRLQHRVNFLWRFHKVHHSSEHLDWLASHREHPLDSLYTIGLINFPVFLLGFNLGVLGSLIAFRGLWAIYIHSNISLPIGPVKYLIGSPELHHWHHARDRDAGNYANISPLMDLLFGTHYVSKEQPKALGLAEEFPKNYTGQILAPMLPKALANRLLKLKKENRPDDTSSFSKGQAYVTNSVAKGTALS